MDLQTLMRLRAAYNQVADDAQTQGQPAPTFEQFVQQQAPAQQPGMAMSQQQFSGGRRPQNQEQLQALLAKRGLLSR